MTKIFTGPQHSRSAAAKRSMALKYSGKPSTQPSNTVRQRSTGAMLMIIA